MTQTRKIAIPLSPAAAVTAVRPVAALVSDWKFVAVTALAMVLLTNLPYWYAYLTTPVDKVFMGIIQNGPDSGEYLAWMRAFMSGALINNPLTPEPNAPTFFNLVFWILAQIARATGWPLVQVLAGFRMASGVLFLAVAYYLVSIFLADRLQRRTAWLLLALGSGLSVYFALFGRLFGKIEFRDQFVAEGNTVYSLMSFPLLMFGAALFTLVLAWAYRAHVTRNLRYALGAGIVGFVLGWSHGYDLILVYAVLGVFTLVTLRRNGIDWAWIKSMALIVGLSVWPALYFVLLTRVSTVWKESLAQFVNAGVFSPNPLNLLLLMGLPLILGLVGLEWFARQRSRSIGELFVVIWFAVNFALIYLPVEYQIHFINGWQVPIAILATWGLFQRVLPFLASRPTLGRWARAGKLAPAMAAVVIAVSLPSSLYFVGWRMLDMSRHPSPYFLDRDQVAALEWLDSEPSDGVVLSAFEIGHYVPGLTGHRPFVAHWAMTLGFFDKQERVAAFFDPQIGDAARLATIERFDVQYVYWSAAERALGAWDPELAQFLVKVWAAPSAAVYRVRN